MFKRLFTIAFATTLAACGSTAGSAASPSGSPLGIPTSPVTATASPASTPSSAPSSAPASAPSAASCTQSATGTLMSGQALLVDVRLGTHDGYDRVVFEFTSRGAPTNEAATFAIAKATPPFLEDPSGKTITISGDTVLGITLRGATIQTLGGQAAYSGSRAFAPRYTKLSELRNSGDFEAVSSWLAGLRGPGCVKAQVLANPTRLVVDLPHQ